MKTRFAILLSAALVACGGDSSSAPKTPGRAFTGTWISVDDVDTVWFYPTQSGSEIHGDLVQAHHDPVHFTGSGDETAVAFTFPIPLGDTVLNYDFHGTYVDATHITGGLLERGQGEARAVDMTKIH